MYSAAREVGPTLGREVTEADHFWFTRDGRLRLRLLMRRAQRSRLLSPDQGGLFFLVMITTKAIMTVMIIVI